MEISETGPYHGDGRRSQSPLAPAQRVRSQFDSPEGYIADDGLKDAVNVALMANVQYKVHAIVTNRDNEPAEELIRWHYQRCGKSEEAHSMKSDFAGGHMPSALFGANAAWWALMILSMNFNSAMKQLVLGEKWAKKRMKEVRFGLIIAPGRVVQHARQFFMRVNQETQRLLFEIEKAMARLPVAQT